jgi:cytochrome c biogenesis protein CcdA/thiol-disulfide isomerase/thioredoxin
MIILYSVAFLSGLLTILAPCIWPLLPIVLADVTQSKSKRRPLGITVGVALSFTILTLSISVLESSLGLNPNVLRKVAVVVLVLLGVSMVIPKASQWLETRISRLSGRFGNVGKNNRSDFSGGFITGLALGIVWAPCSGPILASIATLAATNKVSFQVVIVTLFYVTGVSIPLFGFAVGGQNLLARSRRLSKYTGKIQIAAGVVLILTAIAISTNYDKTLEAKLLNAIPSYSSSLTKIESTKSVSNALAKLKNRIVSGQATINNSRLFNVNTPAAGFDGGTDWLNPAKPVTLSSLKGKVVLVDFWTYTCINCIRTLPHVTSWYNKYHPYGFEVIGVHSPEFAFEQDKGNVLAAIARFNIKYPVVQDNSLSIWNAYNNQYWPAEYLIDANGNIRRADFGEGQYDEMEKAIQLLLTQSGAKVPATLTGVPNTTPTNQLTPETYFGSSRNQFGFPQPINSNGTFSLKSHRSVPANRFDFGGTWTITNEYAQASAGSTITESFSANHVYMILKPHAPGASDRVLVSLDGKPLSGAKAGADVKNGVITVDSDRLYDIYSSSQYTQGVLGFTFQDAGTQAFTFTFG